MDKPRYENDCPRCHFLGCTDVKDLGSADLYYCTNDRGPGFASLSARYGNKGYEYISGKNPCMIDSERPANAWEATLIERAKEKGVWQEPQMKGKS